MIYSARIKQAEEQAKREELLAKGARFLAEMEAPKRSRDQLSAFPLEKAPPQVGPVAHECASKESSLDTSSVEKIPAKRGRYQGGKRRIAAFFFKPLAKAMADGTSFKKASQRLGLTFSEKDENRIRKMEEFRRIRRAYKRLFLCEAWGRVNEPQVLERLVEHEDSKPSRPPRPRTARYISHNLK
jgi:hypothetical protein